MAEEKEVLENTVVLTGYKLASYIILIITGFILTKILGPTMFGLYSALLLVVTFSRYVFISFYSTYYKKGSKLIGQGLASKLPDLRSNTFYPALGFTIVLSAAIAVYSLFVQDYQAAWGLRITAVIVVLQQLMFFYQIKLRTDKDFALYGQVDFVYYLAKLTFYVLLAIPFGVIGAMSGLMISYIVSISWGFYKKPYLVKAKIDFKKARKNFIYGLAPSILGLMGAVFLSIDKIMIIKFFDRTVLGLYSFAVLVLEVVTFIPINIALVMLPRQLESSKKSSKKQNMLLLPMIVISYLIPIIVGAVYAYTLPILNYVFPNYQGASSAIYVLAVGSFFISNIAILESNIVSLDKELKIIIVKILAIITSLSANYYVIKGGYGILGIAIATVGVYIAYFVILSLYTLHQNFGQQGYKHFLVILFPALYTVALLIILDVFPVGTGLLQFLYSTLKYGIFLIFNIPLWYYMNKRTGLIRLAYQQVLTITRGYIYKLNRIR